MTTIKLYLDTRSLRRDGTAPIVIAIRKDRRSALIPTGIYSLPAQWDSVSGVIKDHPRKALLNNNIIQQMSEVEDFVFKLRSSGEMDSLTAIEIKKRFLAFKQPEKQSAKPTVEKRFLSFMEKKQPSTRQLYAHTLSRLRKFSPDFSSLTFEDITAKWLGDFESFLAETAPSKNARNIHLRNIRAVFNDAIDDEITSAYPFRKFKIRPVPTRKRALSVENLRKLFDYPVDEYAKIYRDMFKLIFMLIGINAVDLHRLKSITSEGRIEFSRAKTHRLYSIKIEPEAAALIEEYRGEKGLLCIADRWSDHKNFLHQTNKALRLIGASRKGLGGKKQKDGAFPGISSYWARHSWATIAASLDIPKDTIAAALGHGGNTVTDIYIDYEQSKVDDANRKVLDWVLYGKR